MFSCPQSSLKDEYITLAHGGGGAMTQQLLNTLFYPLFDNAYLKQCHDATVLPALSSAPVVTTDSYVITPYFFPGGDIGELSVTGTLNDLAMSGAKPLYLTAGFIIEEGFPLDHLYTIIRSMAETAHKHQVKIIAGDTKVIERQHAEPNIYINTTGLGETIIDRPPHPSRVSLGDHVILTGDIGRHGIAVMAARTGLIFEPPLKSDCAVLSSQLEAIYRQFPDDIHCARDLTRGGFATACCEIMSGCSYSLLIKESQIPVTEAVYSACELLGLDPYYSACEGTALLIVSADVSAAIVENLQGYLVGELVNRDVLQGQVICQSEYGTERLLYLQSGEQLPRIC